MFVSTLDSRDVDLFPLNWDIVGFEDGLNRLSDFGTNTIPYVYV